MEYLTEKDFEVAEANGISRKLAYHRYYYGGFEKDRAITEPVRKTKRVWFYWEEIATKHGVKKRTFENRIYSLGWDHEEAATTPLGAKKKGKISPEDYKKAEANGICKGTVNFRVHGLKWSVAKAITRPVRKVGRRAAK